MMLESIVNLWPCRFEWHWHQPAESSGQWWHWDAGPRQRLTLPVKPELYRCSPLLSVCLSDFFVNRDTSLSLYISFSFILCFASGTASSHLQLNCRSRSSSAHSADNELLISGPVILPIFPPLFLSFSLSLSLSLSPSPHPTPHLLPRVGYQWMWGPREFQQLKGEGREKERKCWRINVFICFNGVCKWEGNCKVKSSCIPQNVNAGSIHHADPAATAAAWPSESESNDQLSYSFHLCSMTNQLIGLSSRLASSLKFDKRVATNLASLTSVVVIPSL